MSYPIESYRIRKQRNVRGSVFNQGFFFQWKTMKFWGFDEQQKPEWNFEWYLGIQIQTINFIKIWLNFAKKIILLEVEIQHSVRKLNPTLNIS